MNVLMRSLTIAALSACCVQMISSIKQTVRARKQDPTTDTKKVTVTISNESGTSFIKDSAFTKNTDGFAKKLYFDWDKDSKGVNKITVYYKNGSENKTLEKTVTRQEAPEKSEIVIDTSDNVVYMDLSNAIHTDLYRQKDQPNSDTLIVKVKAPHSKNWKVWSGSTTFRIPPQVDSSEGNLGFVAINNSDDNFLKIYSNKPTKIYVQTSDKEIAKWSTLRELAIAKAADDKSDPLIIIDDKGNAKIMSTADYEKAEKAKKDKELSKQIKTIAATVKPLNDGIWKVVSGPQSLTMPIANKVGTTLNLNNKDTKGPDILDYGWYTKAAGGQLEIYENHDTRIYAENQTGTFVLQKLTAQEIKKAGNKPVLVIDNKAIVRVVSSDEYLSTFSRDMEARGIFIGASRKEEKEIPKTVQLKMYLASAGWRKWRSAMDDLKKGTKKNFIQAIEKTIMAEPLTLLQNTILFDYKTSQLESTPDQLNEFVRKIEELQPLYNNIYPNLSGQKIHAYYNGLEKEPDTLKKEVDTFLTALEDAAAPADVLASFRSGDRK